MVDRLIKKGSPCKTFLMFLFAFLFPGKFIKPLRLGCFKDDNIPDLDGFSLESTATTMKQCVNTCRNRRFLFAGVQIGRACFCGNSVGKYGTADASTCNILPIGHGTQTCGANWRSDIYYLGM